MKQLVCSLAVAFTFSALPSESSQAAEWSVPMGGNAFHTAPKPSREGARRNGAIKWSSPKSVFSVYFRIDQPADFLLKIRASGSDGRSLLRVRIGEEVFEVAIEDSEKRVYDVGRIKVPAGYVRVDLQGVDRTGETFADIYDLIVVSDTKALKVDYVKSNKGKCFIGADVGHPFIFDTKCPKIGNFNMRIPSLPFLSDKTRSDRIIWPTVSAKVTLEFR